MIKRTITVLLAAVMLLAVMGMPAFAQPSQNGSDAAKGGYITEKNFSAVNSITTRWQGYYGNITADAGANKIQLSSGSNKMFEWNVNLDYLAGNVFATQANNMNRSNWESLNGSNLSALDSAFDFGTASDNATKTFTNAGQTMTVSSFSKTGPAAYTYVGGVASADWKTVALNVTSTAPVMSEFVFAGLINHAKPSYDGSTKDYQMIVPVKADVSGGQTYYFYVELK